MSAAPEAIIDNLLAQMRSANSAPDNNAPARGFSASLASPGGYVPTSVLELYSGESAKQDLGMRADEFRRMQASIADRLGGYDSTTVQPSPATLDMASVAAQQPTPTYNPCSGCYN